MNTHLPAPSAASGAAHTLILLRGSEPRRIHATARALRRMAMAQGGRCCRHCSHADRQGIAVAVYAVTGKASPFTLESAARRLMAGSGAAVAIDFRTTTGQPI